MLIRPTIRSRLALAGLLVSGCALAQISHLEGAATSRQVDEARGIQGSGLRRMVPADLQRLRPIWLSSLSPDGRHIAMIVGRDPTIRSGYFGARSEFDLMCDVVVVPTAGGPALNITHGDLNGGTSWLLRWSPGGTRLAALTTQGGTDRVRLLTWTVGDQSARILGEHGVYSETRARRSGDGEVGPVAWLNDNALVFIAVDPGHDATTMQIAPEVWRRSLVGRTASSSVLDSGAIRRQPPDHWSTLMRLDVPTQRTVPLAAVPPAYQRQTAVSVEVSPTGRHVAVVGDIGPNAIPPTSPVSSDSERRRRIGIVAVDEPAGERAIEWAPGIAGPRDSSLRWAPDGSRVSIFGKGLPDATATTDPVTPSTTLFVIGTDRRVEKPVLPGQRATSTEWADAGRLLVLARPDGDGRSTSGRQDWWVMETATGGARLLTSALPAVPASVQPLADGRFVGVAEGTWVVLDASGASVLDGDPIAPRAIVWPRAGGLAQGNTLLVQADGPKAEGPTPASSAPWFRVDITGTHVRALPLARPPDSRLVGFHRATSGAGVAVFTGATSTGTHAWTVRDGQSASAVFTNNEFIAEIAGGERRLIEYRNGDGVPLKAALHLPPNYQAGTRIPALVWVYGGANVTSTAALQDKSSTAIYTSELFAAKGVAVLYPSVPMSPNGSPTGEPVNEIAKSVLPAVDRLVEMGIADPQRLAIGGNSYGAYSTYAVLTQTSRFRAAIAADGDANLFTSYTAVSGADRYLDGVAETREGIWWAEASQGRMGANPWQDPLRYLRNSPFFALDRISTPVLIVHGDLDYVPIAHAEEMFAGLDRLGKTARFVRYFGERHGTYSPANLQDLWAQMYRWLDEYLLPGLGGR